MSNQAETLIIQTTIQHRGDKNAFYDFLERFKGPGQLTIHVAPGGKICGFDEIRIRHEQVKSEKIA